MESPGPIVSGRDRRGVSLRTISLRTLILFGVLVLGLTAGLMVASRVVWRATQRVERETQAIAVTEEIDWTLREHHRLGILWVATREPPVAATRAALETDLRRMLLEMQRQVSDADDTRRLASLSDDVNAFLTERKTLEAAGLPLDQLIPRSRGAFDRALASSAAMRSSNRDDLEQARREASRALRFQNLLALVAVAALVIGLALVAFGVRRLILRPVRSLEAMVQRFRAGDADARAEEGPPREMRNLAVAFNEMVDTIDRQRTDQLTFLAGVAHDLRNPLAGVKMLVQALERAPEGATPERLRRLDRQLDRMSRMVGDLLDATRIESGHLELKLEDLDLRDGARAMVDLYAPTTTTHQVVLTVPEDPVIVHADPLRIEQVISNLLSNAIKYSPGGGLVEVSVKVAGGRAALSVSDHGLGIPAKDIPSLFQPFRTRLRLPETIPGVGLGLSIVRRIVWAHGGQIEVDSEPNVGSTFRVWLAATHRPS